MRQIGTGSMRSQFRQADPTIRALFLKPIADELTACSLSAEGVLRQHGLHHTLLNQPYERISLRRYVALAENAADQTCRPRLLFELGAGFDIVALGPLCTLLLSSPTVRLALEYLIRFFSAWQTDTELVARKHDQVTIYSYAIRDPSIWPRRQDAEGTLASIASLIRSLVGPDWNPVAVGFEHAVPENVDRFQAHFRCPISGHCPTNLLVVKNDTLDRARLALDHDTRKLLHSVERHLVELLEPGESDDETLVDDAARVIARRLGSSPFGIREVAAEMNLSERTLRRRLRALGTSYSDILEEQRMVRAIQLLATSPLPLSELAELLGYSDSAVFSRAFKRWSGAPPRTYCRRRESPDEAPLPLRGRPSALAGHDGSLAGRRHLSPPSATPRATAAADEAEIDRLRREIAELKVERDRLRQAAAMAPRASS